MNATTYDETSKIAKIQPGSDWKRVFDTLDPYGVAAVGGRASVVGVGGFVTGGGVSDPILNSSSLHRLASCWTLLWTHHGFITISLYLHTHSTPSTPTPMASLATTSPTLRSCSPTALLPTPMPTRTPTSGRLSRAAPETSPSSHESISVRRQTSSFAQKLTRLDTVDSTALWGGFTDYDFENRDEVFNAYLNFADNMGDDPNSQNIVAVYYDNTGFSLRSILTNSIGDPAAPAFDEYFTVANISSTARVGTVAELVPEFTGPTPLGL